MRRDSTARCGREVRHRRVRRRPTVPPLAAPLTLLATLGVCLPAWALHWPWHHHGARPAAGAATPSTVHAIAVTSSTVGQAWDRNTLLLDLTRQAGAGAATLTRLPGAGWPMRLEFRVRPGAMTRLEVQGAQRVVFSVPAHGAPLILELDPGVYVTDTTRIMLRWSAAAG